MTELAPNTKLPYIAPGQAQKHVTHNEAIRMLDALLQLTVLDRDLTAPPGSPANGARYIVAATATAAWAGQENKIAAFQDGAWTFYTPAEGWRAWVADEDVLVGWTGAAWSSVGGGGGGSSAPAGPVYNANMQRAWSKCAAMLIDEAAARLNVVVFGDSVAPFLREVLDARLKVEYVNGGFGGRLVGECGFHDDGNGTLISETSDDFTHSPNGKFWDLAAGGSKYWGVGSTNNLDPLPVWHPDVFQAPRNVTRIGIYYTRRTGGGTFKVQISTKQADTTFVDVAGLTAIDTDGALELMYQEVTVSETDVDRIRVEHVTGNNCYIVGALVAADVGVVTHAWNVGGSALTDLVNSARFSELTALVPADIVTAMFLDSPGDTAASTGLTVTQLVDGITNGIRTAFPATQVPASVSPWSGKTALADRAPHFVWFGANKVEAPGSLDEDDYNAAIKANALANDDCFVDTTAIWGAWRDGYDMGVMSDGDGNGASTHGRPWLYGSLISALLKETHLIGGAFMRPIPSQKLDKLHVGGDAPVPGSTYAANRMTVGDGTSHFSAGPANINGFGDIAAGVTSGGPVFECGFLFRSTAANGRTYLLSSQPGGGFIMRDTGMGNFLQFNANRQLSLAGLSNATMAWGPKGQHSSGMRHGLASLTAGVVTVTNSNITANARIVLTRQSRGGTPGVTYEYTATAGSFTITSRDSADAVETADTSTISYIVIEP